MIRPYLKSALIGLMAGLLGVLVGLEAIHAYNDHAALHAIINMINANTAKQAPK